MQSSPRNIVATLKTSIFTLLLGSDSSIAIFANPLRACKNKVGVANASERNVDFDLNWRERLARSK